MFARHGCREFFAFARHGYGEGIEALAGLVGAPLSFGFYYFVAPLGQAGGGVVGAAKAHGIANTTWWGAP